MPDSGLSRQLLAQAEGAGWCGVVVRPQCRNVTTRNDRRLVAKLWRLSHQPPYCGEMSSAGTVAPIRVLLVDDHRRLRTVMAQSLGKALPAEVAMCGDIPTALTLLRSRTFDAVVSDVNLPGLSGLEAIPQLRSACPRGRVLLISATDSPGLAETALRAGADAFVTKSAGIHTLCQAIVPGWRAQ